MSVRILWHTELPLYLPLPIALLMRDGRSSVGKSLVSSSSRSLPGSELECCPGDPLPSSPLLSSLPANERGSREKREQEDDPCI